MSKKIVVLGATGNVGRFLTKNLLAKGAEVVAASRSGAPVAGQSGTVFDYAQSERYADFAQGADAVYIMLPTGYPDVAQVLQPIFDCAAAQGTKVVLHTALEASVNPDHHTKAAENLLISSGLKYAILRPSWYMQNFMMFWPKQMQDGLLELAAGAGAMSLVHVEDIAEAACDVLLGQDNHGKAYQITGPESLTFAQALAHLSEAVGKDIVYKPLSAEEQILRYVAVGASDHDAAFMTTAYQQVSQGNAAAIWDDYSTLTGKSPRDFNQYVAEFATEHAKF